MEKFKFENLKVYQEALSFIDYIYDITKTWTKSETYSLIDQLKRAAVSIALNTNEGSSRTKKDVQHFLSISGGVRHLNA